MRRGVSRRALLAEDADLRAQLQDARATVRRLTDNAAGAAERAAASTAEAATKQWHCDALGEGLTVDHRAMQARLDRALRAVVRLRRENAELGVLLDNASDRLFQAMGYNDAALSRLGVPLPDESLLEPGEVSA